MILLIQFKDFIKKLQNETFILQTDQMQVYEIQTMTFLKAIENIGGLQSFSFMILGIISSYFLPKLFRNKISNNFYQS
jgi:hypothetical protein